MVCHARTGSTLLIDALGQHPDAKIWNELFTLDLDARRAHAAPDPPIREDEDGATYLAALYDRAERARYLAAGFKLMFSHAPTAPTSSLWSYLGDHNEVRVIFLRRIDLLACFVSLQIASRTRRWNTRTTDHLTEETTPEFVAPGALARYFDFITGKWREVEERFANHPQLALDYDRDLCAAFPSTIERTFQFLDLAPTAVHPGFQKLESWDIRARVSNYDELARHFANTPYSRYFSHAER